MRNALTLIELILSMVIIGIVFTVIPRLIMSMNQSSQATIKEEAMYNALAQMGMILNLPWDNNNTQNPQILSVTAGDALYECNTTSGYRIGGFVGSRHCREINGTDYNASLVLGKEDDQYNDIDDYDGNITIAKASCSTGSRNLYNIGTSVFYRPDNGIGTATGTTNTKAIQVKVGYHGDNKFHDAAKPNCITDLNYTSYNIGDIHIYSSTETGDWQ